jgi:hypothetical protein
LDCRPYKPYSTERYMKPALILLSGLVVFSPTVMDSIPEKQMMIGIIRMT